MEHESLHQFVEAMIADGIISTKEHEEFMDLVHEDNEIDEEESALISKIFKLISSGQVKVVDEERDKVCRETSEQIKKEAVDSDIEMQSKEPLQLLKQSPERQKEIAEAMNKVKKEKEASRNKIDEFFASKEG